MSRPMGAVAAPPLASPPEALQQLTQELAGLRLAAAAPALRAAVKALQIHDFARAENHALQILDIDPALGLGWRLLGLAREKQGELTSALLCYERALGLEPDHATLAGDLGRLATALKLPELAARFYAAQLARTPGCLETMSQLAVAYRQLSRFDEAVELLRFCLEACPDDASLWNSLGSVLAEEGRIEEAMVFYDEAVRLNGSAVAVYNRAHCRLAMGDAAGAVADCDRALVGYPDAREATQIRFARSNALLTAGRVGEGWDAYEVRTEPLYVDHVHHAFEGPVWEPGAELRGRRLLVVGEQGLGDEVMFASVLPDVIEDLGPDGRLILAVEPRLVRLMQRSFPSARVIPHVTLRVTHQVARLAGGVSGGDYDLWTRIGRLLRGYRRTVDDFPARPVGFLRAEPARVEHWRRSLGEVGPGPKVGVLWKSLKMTADRLRFFSPFEQWRGVLETPGVTFINLQYGECAAELEEARARYGVDIRQPPVIDLKDDLDDLAALSLALDLTVGPATATTNIAAAAGAATWFISTPDAWPRLGTDRYPWYAQARVFSPRASYDWPAVMADVAGALRAEFPPR